MIVHKISKPYSPHILRHSDFACVNREYHRRLGASVSPKDRSLRKTLHSKPQSILSFVADVSPCLAVSLGIEGGQNKAVHTGLVSRRLKFSHGICI